MLKDFKVMTFQNALLPVKFSRKRHLLCAKQINSSDMQVSWTQREALHPLASSVTGLW